MAESGKKRYIQDDILQLVNPAPSSFDLESALDSLDSARVVDKDELDKEVEVEGLKKSILRRRNVPSYLDADPRYAGKAIDRRHLHSDEGSDQETKLNLDISDQATANREKVGETSTDEEDPVIGSDADEEDPITGSDADEEDPVIGYGTDDEGPVNEDHLTEEGSEDQGDFEDETRIFSGDHENDIKKGQQIKVQLGLWDGLLEGRIRLQKLLPLCNQLPQGEHFEEFTEATLQQREIQNQCVRNLKSILEDLLDLQSHFIECNKELSTAMSGCGQSSEGVGHSDEEITSESSGDDSEAGERPATGKKRSSKYSWGTSAHKKKYEKYISGIHRRFENYRDNTITKWSNKGLLSSGKLVNKSFLQINNSVTQQIKNVLQEKSRLIRRTQLNRAPVKILGEPSNDEVGVSQDMENDSHLKDFNVEIFDDSDFYHQLLRELIQQKMSTTALDDTVAMGRQWVQLQKLRRKVKKKVDTKASKGRKIRYKVHPKLVGFMAPVNSPSLSNTARYDLFSSLFGQRQKL